MVRLFQKGLKSASSQRESKRGEQCEPPFQHTLLRSGASSGLKSYVACGLSVEHMDLVSTRPGWEGGEKNGKDAETVKQLPAWVGTVPLRSPG